jgi:SAM-dependent methyltransferase
MTEANERAFSSAAVRAAYDLVAQDYVAAFGGDLEQSRLDCEVLDGLVAAVPEGGVVADLGCGPGSVTAYLRARGACVVGVDLSIGMLRLAVHAGLPTAQGDLRRLPLGTGLTFGAVAYYSLQHLPREHVPIALGEARRILQAGGTLALATHLGKGDVYLEEFLGHQIEPIGGCPYGREELLSLLEDCGFKVVWAGQRGPMAHEADTQRLYVLAEAR